MIIKIEKTNIKESSNEVAKIINKGGVAIIPTDTIYGMVADCFNIESVKKIYEIKGRDKKKPFLILVKNIEDVKLFSDMEIPKEVIEHIPGMLTLILPIKEQMKSKLAYLNETIAIRIPNDEFLQAILSKTNPIVAPSANPSGAPNINDPDMLTKLFENKVELIAVKDNKNEMPSPSTIYDCINKKVLRKGSVVIK